MPTKKRRVGFIPRNDVLDLINKLSHESNLSNSKIINILVEEALCKRGLFNITTGKANIVESKEYINKNKEETFASINNKFIYDFKNENLNIKEDKEASLDRKMYAKFLMFLQFQERMKKETYK